MIAHHPSSGPPPPAAPAREGLRRGFLLLLCLLVAGCAAPGPRGGQSDAPTRGIERIALLPMVDMARVYGEGRSVRAPLTHKVFVTGQTAGALADRMTAAVEAHLRGEGDYRVVSPGTVRGAMGPLLADRDRASDERSLMMAAARAVEAEAVLVGYIYRHEPRRGGRFAVDRPASLAYGLYLLARPDGRIVWAGEFDETQRPLNEDLLQIGTFLKRRGEWITVEEMALESLAEILARFPSRSASGEGGTGAGN